MNILNLFKPSPEEQQLEAELSGTATPKPTVQPPKRGTSSNLPEAGADSELMQLRSSLATVESRLQAVTSERDSLKAEFSQYRAASQADQRELEQKNQRLQSTLNETAQALSRKIASEGQQAAIPGDLGGIEEQPHGLQRSIQAAKAEANRTHSQKPLTRPTL